ncbi:6-carboxytetrahydropterin synthase [Flavobacterium sp.]|uniref:6-carboxytetrahydropterin synthase n=1 Tax=Flavobacterium sp. TaxID=239 RepID=UPI000EDCCAC7|nr:6-carboxytetrahydropterin synthase [Flavobacterium sp.]HCQ14294.1 6-pyruvoyl tetrahydrobiopterin synthase [Flavobacterium sp.]
MKTTICREVHFNASHRMHNPNWSDKKNTEVYGICNNRNFHGHNYRLIVKLTGEVDPESGFIINLHDLSTIIKTEIEDRFDHKNLNLDCPEFENKMVSTENFAWIIYFILKEKLSEKLKIKVILYETDRNFVEVEEQLK